MAMRRQSWKIPTERQKVKGLLGKYRKAVSSAHIGAVTFWTFDVLYNMSDNF